jgi:feruloyl esterase
MALPGAFAQAPHRCADMMGFKAPGVALEITKAEPTPASAPGTMRISPSFPGFVSLAVPPFCRVDGVIDRRTGIGGKTYGIRFALGLPDSWNGRFLFQGGGGLNGSIAPPLGANAANAPVFLCDLCGEPIWLWLAGRAAPLPAQEQA